MEHGSGTYRSEQFSKLLSKNRSIEVSTNVSARYLPTSFSLPRGRSIDYSSRWSEIVQAKNRETGAAMDEEYRYATRIDRESYMKMDKNESKLRTETDFEGLGHIGFLKKSDPNATAKVHPVLESSEDYLGSFHVYAKVSEYGQSVQSERSASGTGAVAVDKRIRESQRTYEHGTGTYQSDEQISTPISYIAKDINATHSSMRYKLTPNSTWINASYKWTEGILSQTKGTSYLGEEISSADYIEAESFARGLNDLESKANYSGRGTFRVIQKGEINLDEEYIGRFNLSRKIHLTGVARYDEPHLSLTKEGQIIPNTTTVRYNIIVLNDGNRALGPIYVKDLFPFGTSFINSSVKPTDLTRSYANWTFLYLSIGQSVAIDLRLNVTDEGNDLINTVQAAGGYNGLWATASNFSAIEINWLPCSTPQISATKSAKIEKSNIVLYRLAIKNNARSPMVARAIDYLPTDMRFINASLAPEKIEPNNVSWVLTDIAPGETRTVDYRVEALRNGRFVNSAHIEGYIIDGSGTATAEASAAITVGGISLGTTRSGWQPPDWDFDLSENICGACYDEEPQSEWQPPDWDLDLSEICGACDQEEPQCASCPTCG
jgi:uncharacterized repeat protein (TIGR01451 family)